MPRILTKSNTLIPPREYCSSAWSRHNTSLPLTKGWPSDLDHQCFFSLPPTLQNQASGCQPVHTALIGVDLATVTNIENFGLWLPSCAGTYSVGRPRGDQHGYGDTCLFPLVLIRLLAISIISVFDCRPALVHPAPQSKSTYISHF